MKKLAIFVAFVLVFGMTSGAFAHKSQVISNYEIEVGWENEPPLVGHENAITVMITNAPEDAEEMTHDEEMSADHIQEEHEAILQEHDQMMQEHTQAMEGNADKADVEEMMHKHMSLMEKHEKIMEEHESMQDQMTQEQIDTMMSSHEQIRKDHEQMNQDHEKILEMYGIEESEHDRESMDSDAEEHDHEEGISGLESAFESYITLNGKMTALDFVEDQDLPGLYVAQYTPNEAGHPVVHLVVTINDEVVEADFHPEEIEEHIMTSPLAQQKEGISPNEVECSEDKVLMSKTSNGGAICVTESTAEKLLARNWAKYF
ncbi:MAG: hypothetical protein FJ357_04590 [Thaumarchaeota archaeon]|nr:hypothetical protein [Nitrososphaerota archaeon]